MAASLALTLASRRVAARSPPANADKAAAPTTPRRHLHFPRLPATVNETMRHYAPGSEDAKQLAAAIARIRTGAAAEIPAVVNGREVHSDSVTEQRNPSRHGEVVARVHNATRATAEAAVAGAVAAQRQWAELPFERRAAVFLKAADLLATKYRYEVLAATVAGQGKTYWQAEIDAAAETIDFWRYNVKFAEEIYHQQPVAHAPHTWNRVEYRPLEGFVAAISPFNFTAIGGNLSAAPALMGNTVVWKPSHTAALSNYLLHRTLREAGLPDGVIQFVPGEPDVVGDAMLGHRELAGLHFTGSTGTFQRLQLRIAQGIADGRYRSYPRVVGETGGKGFHVLHESGDVDTFVRQTVRGAFEYQGQKCSACSRIYVPDSLWPAVRQRLAAEIAALRVGPADEPASFMAAVIDARSFAKIRGYIDHARQHPADAELVLGGRCDDSRGYFVEPTVVLAKQPRYRSLVEEIFGPVLTVYVYKAAEPFDAVLQLIDDTSAFALTGALFARDAHVIDAAARRLRNAAGNFYINDKCTGAVVGQQPFGGSRLSGTNDKAGAALNLLRWVSPRTIKENYVPLGAVGYPSMG